MIRNCESALHKSAAQHVKKNNTHKKCVIHLAAHWINAISKLPKWKRSGSERTWCEI